MLIFALTNGYASTLIMLAAVVEPLLEEHEVDVSYRLTVQRTYITDAYVLTLADCGDLHGLLSHSVSLRANSPLGSRLTRSLQWTGWWFIHLISYSGSCAVESLYPASLISSAEYRSIAFGMSMSYTEHETRNHDES